MDKTPNEYDRYLGHDEGIVVYVHTHDVKRFVILDTVNSITMIVA